MQHRLTSIVWCVALCISGVDAAIAAAQPDDRPAPEPITKPSDASKKPAPAKPAQTPARRGLEDDLDNDSTKTVPARHPVITEVLYAVPTGDAGDTNRDGTRHVSGDEFIEILNPHDEPIQMLGYVLTDVAAAAPRGKGGGGGGGGGVRFAFPAFELPAHATLVVFNGNSATWAGPIGDAKSAPKKADEAFGNGYVFTMRLSSQRAAFGNASDAVMLSAPDGKIVQRVRWGKAAEGEADTKIALDETAPAISGGSIVRIGEGSGASWRPHTEVDLKPFSPGAPLAKPAEPEKPQPDEAPKP